MMASRPLRRQIRPPGASPDLTAANRVSRHRPAGSTKRRLETPCADGWSVTRCKPIGSTTVLGGGDAMASGGGDDDLIGPDALRRISEEKEMEKLKEVLRKQQKAEEEAHAFHRTFMEQEVN